MLGNKCGAYKDVHKTNSNRSRRHLINTTIAGKTPAIAAATSSAAISFDFDLPKVARDSILYDPLAEMLHIFAENPVYLKY